MSERTTTIVLVRHGQTAWNRPAPSSGVRFRGQADPALDAVGQKQAVATARYLAERWPVQAVYASPLVRGMETATVIAEAQGLTAQPFEGLLDIDFGELARTVPRSRQETVPRPPARLVRDTTHRRNPRWRKPG